MQSNLKKLERLKKITHPFLLRRLKTDENIVKELPEKIVDNKYVKITPEQAALYQAALDDSQSLVFGESQKSRAGNILRLLGQLKQICNHPSNFIRPERQDQANAVSASNTSKT